MAEPGALPIPCGSPRASLPGCAATICRDVGEVLMLGVTEAGGAPSRGTDHEEARER